MHADTLRHEEVQHPAACLQEVLAVPGDVLAVARREGQRVEDHILGWSSLIFISAHSLIFASAFFVVCMFTSLFAALVILSLIPRLAVDTLATVLDVRGVDHGWNTTTAWRAVRWLSWWGASCRKACRETEVNGKPSHDEERKRVWRESAEASPLTSRDLGYEVLDTKWQQER